MKTILISLLLFISINSHASLKVCLWVKGDIGSQGESFAAIVKPEALYIESISGLQWDGGYGRVEQLDKRDSKVERYLLHYDAPSAIKDTYFLVSSELLLKDGNGFIRVVNSAGMLVKYKCETAK